MTISSLPALVSIKQAAEHLGISYITLWRRVKKGDIKSYRMGRAIRVAEADIIKYMEVKGG